MGWYIEIFEWGGGARKRGHIYIIAAWYYLPCVEEKGRGWWIEAVLEVGPGLSKLPWLEEEDIDLEAAQS